MSLFASGLKARQRVVNMHLEFENSVAPNWPSFRRTVRH
jgi:hypothetical protein